MKGKHHEAGNSGLHAYVRQAILTTCSSDGIMLATSTAASPAAANDMVPDSLSVAVFTKLRTYTRTQ